MNVVFNAYLYLFTGLWGIVNNAGIWMVADIEMTSQASYEKVLNTNFFGVVRMTRTFIPLIRKAKGRIVNVSSILGKYTCGEIILRAGTGSTALNFALYFIRCH
jgi:NAD(P)-dependent dehydrogenase (short-subunit alcohol dehydrogenase family)